ncbi:MAG: aldehyde dehydrogenase family protein [Polyangiales bacterium]
MSLELPLLDRPGDYIGGAFVRPAPADGALVIQSPADVHQHVSTHEHAVAHVDRAVETARAAFRAWRRQAPEARAERLRRYQARVRAHREDLALAIALEVGKPLWEARTEVDSMIGKVDLVLGEGARFTATQELRDVPGEIRHRPLGVLAVIGPFNFPGHLPNGQIVPALALGNCVVHKPSEKTPSAASLMARCFDEAGFPRGVFNLVQGPAEVGRRLTVHADIEGILFTGSVAVGRRIVADNAARPERLIALELGGKNAAIALDDCDLERTARAIAFAAFATAGQRCTSTSRLIATPGIAVPLTERIVEITRALRVGHPLDAEVFMGPMISSPSRAGLLAAQAHARDAGYDALIPGGVAEVPGHDGFYVMPAIHRASRPGLSVEGYTDHELFGPDLAIEVAEDLDAAVAAANGTRFGLAASVFTRSADAFERAAEDLRVGVVHWNRSSAGASGRLPFGGVKESGNHRAAGILVGGTCSHPQAVLLEPSTEGPLPSWPGSGLTP